MKTVFLFLVVAASLALFCTKPSTGEYPVDATLGFSTGPQIGDRIPAFSLPDQYGKMRDVRQLIGANGALLNFYRSASW